MASKEEIKARAKEIIKSSPTSGKDKINYYLRAEFGRGLRSETILKLKEEVVSEHPRLASQLYARGGVSRGLLDIYNGWREAGFLPFEARELTVGHGNRYKAFNSSDVFSSIPGQAARETRAKIIQEQLSMGWSLAQIRDNIIDFYRRGRETDVWTHIRAEYKPRARIDLVDYRDKVQRRAKARQQRLLKGHPISDRGYGR